MELRSKFIDIVRKHLQLDPVEDFSDDAKACIVQPQGVAEALEQAFVLGATADPNDSTVLLMLRQGQDENVALRNRIKELEENS